MSNENGSNRLTSRATSRQITTLLHLVCWKGGEYVVQGNHSGEWKIRHRGIPGVLHTVVEQEGLGKEEAIAWIEANL